MGIVNGRNASGEAFDEKKARIIDQPGAPLNDHADRIAGADGLTCGHARRRSTSMWAASGTTRAIGRIERRR